MELPLYRVKKKQRLIYRHYPDWPSYELKVICKEDWGIPVIKCKVITKGWYSEVYLTQNDLNIQVGSKGFSRVVFK